MPRKSGSEIDEFLNAEKHSASLMIAVVSFMNGAATEELRMRTLGVAQRMEVTTSDYLRTRLLLQAGLLKD